MPRSIKRTGGEDRLLRWLRRRIPQTPAPALIAGIGDDAAVLPASGPIAVTVDSQIAGIHFVPGLDPALVARRLLAVNLSDLAAMGATPAYAFLALTAMPGFDHQRFFRALIAACANHRLRLAGGDLSRSPDGGLVATLTLIGGKRRGSRWLHRTGAAPGHQLWLGGTSGESAAGRLLIAAGARLAGGKVTLPEGWGGRQASEPAEPARLLAAAARRAVRRHLQPQPQLALGQWLGRQVAGAAIDVSDGIARDLSRLCGESGVGARIEAGQLPLGLDFVPLCAALGTDPQELALAGGEDYVLLFTLPAGLEPPAAFGCRHIGVITSQRRLLITTREAKRTATRRLEIRGWDHLAGDQQKER